MRWFLSALCFVGIVLVSTAWAHADSGGSQPVGDPATLIISSVLGIIGTYLAHRVIKLFEQKTGIDIPDREEQMVNKWVDEGRALAEEKAAVLIKFGKEQMPGSKKHEIATDYAMDRVDKANLRHKFTREVVSHKMDARVNAHRTR